MKLLLLSVKSDTPTGGIAVWTDHFLAHCQEHDLDCRLVNTEVSARRHMNKLRRLWAECFRTIRIFRQLSVAFREQSYDFAHLNTSCGPMGLYRDYFLAKRLHKKGIPFAMHYHCDIPFWVKTEKRCRWLKKSARLAAVNMVLCESSRIFLEKIGLDAVKVPNFIRDGIVMPTEKDIRPTLSHIFFVGRVSINKGAAELYRLARRFPDKTFTLAGSVIPPVDSWDKPDNVTCLGPVPYDRVMSLLDEADLFLFPSRSEGFSVALMEAMARGVPCVAFDNVGANGDMLGDNCGIATPYGNLDAMEHAIRYLEDPTVRTHISENAVSKVRDNYTTDAVLTLFEKLYKNNM